MNSVIAAFATDGGNYFIKRHFGDAQKYLLYRITKTESELLNTIINSTEDENEDIHADPKKAGSIAKLLKQERVQVAVAKIFGPNIKRIKKKFVCVVINTEEISEGIIKLQNIFDEIISEWKKGETRSHIVV